MKPARKIDKFSYSVHMYLQNLWYQVIYLLTNDHFILNINIKLSWIFFPLQLKFSNDLIKKSQTNFIFHTSNGEIEKLKGNLWGYKQTIKSSQLAESKAEESKKKSYQTKWLWPTENFYNNSKYRNKERWQIYANFTSDFLDRFSYCFICEDKKKMFLLL